MDDLARSNLSRRVPGRLPHQSNVEAAESGKAMTPIDGADRGARATLPEGQGAEPAASSAQSANGAQPGDIKTMQPPRLEYAFQIEIELTPRYRYGPGFWGLERGFVGVEGGTVTGPRLNGKIVPHSGGDWPSIRADHTVKFDARYLIELDDGTLVELRNRGIRHGSKAVLDRLQTYQPVDPSEYYASVSPSFDAPEGPHDWLCKTMFVGKVDRKADRAVFTYWSVG